MSKSKQIFIIASIVFTSTLLAKLPQSFTTQSQKTHVTITIYPNENIEDDDDQGENNNHQGKDNKNNQNKYRSQNFLTWLKSLFK